MKVLSFDFPRNKYEKRIIVKLDFLLFQWPCQATFLGFVLSSKILLTDQVAGFLKAQYISWKRWIIKLIFLCAGADRGSINLSIDILLYSQKKLDRGTKLSLHHSVHCGGINPPSKTPPLLSRQVPSPLNLQKVQASSFLGNPPLYIVFLWTPPLSPPKKKKNQIFQWISKILKFLIIKPILSFKSNNS